MTSWSVSCYLPDFIYWIPLLIWLEHIHTSGFPSSSALFKLFSLPGMLFLFPFCSVNICWVNRWRPLEKLPRRSQLLSLPYTTLWWGRAGQGRFLFSRTLGGGDIHTKEEVFKKPPQLHKPFSLSGILKPVSDIAQLLFHEPLWLGNIYWALAKYPATSWGLWGSEHV